MDYPVTEINNIEQLGRYRDAWHRLLRQTPKASFFQTLEWLEVYWRYYGKGQNLRVLLVGDEDNPTGILPFVLRSECRRVGKIRVLTYPLDDWGSYFGPIGNFPRDILKAGLKHLHKTRRDWDNLSLRWIESQSETAVASEECLNETGYRPQTSVRMQAAVINIDHDWDQYFRNRGSKWRNNYKRWMRTIEKNGEPRFVRYRPRGEAEGESDPRWDLYQTCVDIASRSWQANSPDGTTISHKSISEYLRATHEAAAKIGCADINLLYIDERPVAFAYNYIFDKSVYSLRVGYDASESTKGIGSVMWAWSIRDSFKRKDRFYNMGPGSLEYKKFFLTDICDVLQYDYFSPFSLRAQLLRLKASLPEWLTRKIHFK